MLKSIIYEFINTEYDNVLSDELSKKERDDNLKNHINSFVMQKSNKLILTLLENMDRDNAEYNYDSHILAKTILEMLGFEELSDLSNEDVIRKIIELRQT